MRYLPAALVLLLAASGCNRSGLVEVSGRLTYKGQPVPSTYVIFQPDDETKRASRGVTDDNGNFTLTNSRSDTGAFLGGNTVLLQYHLTAQEEMHEVPPKASKELKAVIAKYGEKSKTTLHYEVTKSGQFIEINLE
jgi:hypothetical protein